MFENKTILITGGSGSWGNELTKQLLEKNPKEIIIYSRGEFAQVNMQRKFNNKKLSFVIGDIRDLNMLDQVFRINDIDYVFHLAALKHVPICENQPQEAIKTNIIGTTNLVNISIKYGIKKFIDVSTDKAVSPSNLYGMTKAIGEKITIQANNLTPNTDFICIRGGNVLGSNGSVLPFFIDQIKTKNMVTITDNRMTRYFLTLPEAIHLLFQAIEKSVGGEIFVMNMPSFYITDLARVLIDAYGNEDTKLIPIGMREGEKLHELLISKYESNNTFKLNDDYYVIYPELNMNSRTYYYDNNDYVNFDEFSSKDNLKSPEFLTELLDNAGFLPKK